MVVRVHIVVTKWWWPGSPGPGRGTGRGRLQGGKAGICGQLSTELNASWVSPCPPPHHAVWRGAVCAAAGSRCTMQTSRSYAQLSREGSRDPVVQPPGWVDSWPRGLEVLDFHTESTPRRALPSGTRGPVGRVVLWLNATRFGCYPTVSTPCVGTHHLPRVVWRRRCWGIMLGRRRCPLGGIVCVPLGLRGAVVKLSAPNCGAVGYRRGPCSPRAKAAAPCSLRGVGA